MNSKYLLSLDGRSNILATWLQASAEERLRGRDWYSHAKGFCRVMADKHGYEYAQVAGVVAAMSPLQTWQTNCKQAEACVVAHKAGLKAEQVSLGLPRNVAKSWKILSGENPLDILGGNKVRSFYANIMDSLDTVTVDRHAFSVWLGVRVIETPGLTDKVYRHISDAYVQVAEGLGVPPSVVQATTWVVYKRIHNLAD